jgi:ATP-grasp domain, R2K clade family 2
MAFDPELVWLIQENQEDRLTVGAIKGVLDVLNVRWIGIEIDFKTAALPSIEGLREGDRVLCFGPSFITRIDHRDPVWRIGSIFDPDSFRWSQFQANWPGKMLSRDGNVTSVRTLRIDPPELPIFTRPDADSKTFDGGIRSRFEFEVLLKRLDADLPIVTASPTIIDAEYRMFMVASEVVAASEYRRNGRTSMQGFVPNAAVDLALEADRIWRPAESYAIDVGRSGERFGIIEANCITAARHYAADTRAIVEALCRHYGTANRERRGMGSE